MRFLYLAAAVTVAGGVAGWLWPAHAQPTMPMDTPTTMNGIDTVCTGIGSDAQSDPRWLAYPIRIEFSNGGAQYLSGAHVDLATGAGKPLVSLDCAGPWVLFRLEPGTYKVTASLNRQQGGGTASATFQPPRAGQRRVVLRFPVQPNQ